MSTFNVPIDVKRAELRAVVTRADGSIEDLGVIATTEQPTTAATALTEQGQSDDGQNPE